MNALRSTLTGFFLLALGVAGCNSILDNNRGHLDTSQAPTSVENNDPDPSTDDTTDSGATSSGPCASTQKLCDGSCVSKDDPSYGCSATGCSACSTTNATSTCTKGACAIKACDPGHDDCNGKASDGCEVDLTLAASCGSCDGACDATKPVCVPSGKTFACSTGCTPEAPLLCGTSCVSPLTSANHCGGCEIKCPTVPGGVDTCQTGICTLACNAGYHACGTTKCALDTDTTACGAACTVCPIPANGTATCAANACGLACTAGFGDCNMLAADGCEANLSNDPLNCGVCGTDCHGGACLNKICQPAPDAAVP